jgi:TRAP-type C4-dicarboxylate transport system permease small subunit
LSDSNKPFTLLTKRVASWMAYGGAFVLASMMYITFFDVVGRFVFNRPFTGSVEVIALLMGLLIFLGAGLVTFENGHIRVDVITLLLPPRLRALLDFVVHVLSLGIASLMCWRLWVLALEQTAELNETQVLGLPVWATALIMAACSFMIVFGLVLHLRPALFQLFGNNKSGSEK